MIECVSFFKMEYALFLIGGNEMNLKDEMDDYLKNKFINYAILIKGEWGSGKTFFVKKNVV